MADIQIHYFAIYKSKSHMQAAFREVGDFAGKIGFDDIKEDDFIMLNDNYLQLNDSRSMENDSDIANSYLSVLSNESLYFQYGFKCPQLELDDLFTYMPVPPADVERLISSHQNKINYSSYFRFPETRKLFQSEYGVKFRIDTRKTLIDGQEYIYFENVPEPDFFYGSLLLDRILLSIENNEVLATYTDDKDDIIFLNKKLQDVYKALFISGDPSDNLTFIYCQHQFWIYCLEVEKNEDIEIGNTIYKDCIVITHRELELGRTIELKKTGIKNRLHETTDFYRTYWAKDVGLIRILLNDNIGNVIYDCISIGYDFHESFDQRNLSVGIHRPEKKMWWEFWR